MTKAIITGTELEISEREPLLAGSVNLNKIELSFSGEWSQLTRQIDFKNEKSGESRRISAQMKTCTVPWEVLKAEGDVSCYIRGIGSDGKLKLRTNEVNLGTVLGASDETVPGTGTPTPDVCDETAAKIGKLGMLKTSEKSEIVAAINEVKQTADNKQDKLIAGDNITISEDGKTISAAGGAKLFNIVFSSQADTGVVSDKSYDEIKAALTAGCVVRLTYIDGRTYLPQVTYNEQQVNFAWVYWASSQWHTVDCVLRQGNVWTGDDVILPTKTSQLENDGGYLTLATLPKYEGAVE